MNQVFKKLDLTCSNHFFKTFPKLSLSLRLSKAPQRIFCRSPPNFLLSFSLDKPVCLYYPSFCIVFHVLCIISWFLGKIFGLCIFGIFDESNLILWIWSMGFVAILIYSWSMMVNLINLGIYKKSKILGLVLNLNWGFCSNWFQLMKLACWIDEIDHYFLKSILYDDQLVNLYRLIKWFFKYFGVLFRNSMFKPNFVNLN